MSIPYFAEHQNDVFIPALAVTLLATAFLVFPVIAAPLLKRARRVVQVVAILLGCVALAAAAALAGAGFRTLDEQRADVQRTIAAHYGLHLSDAQVSSLLEGGKVKLDDADGPRTLKLVPAGPGDYALSEAQPGQPTRTA